jgi:hypothetical protein
MRRAVQSDVIVNKGKIRNEGKTPLRWLSSYIAGKLYAARENILNLYAGRLWLRGQVI